MSIFPDKSYIKDNCPTCGGKLYIKYEEIMMEKLAESEHERTVYCNNCTFTEKRIFKEV